VEENEPLLVSHFKGLSETTSHENDVLFAEERSYY